ncbi:MAG: NAD(P)H-hydrate epimerase [Planctomycetota bacterium]|nr:NAD(P)H-hydrate epimerase [Planctomycetota bacterium]
MTEPSSQRHDGGSRGAMDAPAPPGPKAFILDRASVRSIDRAAIDEYGIPGIALMENASRALARQALRLLDEAGAPAGTVLIVCGSGNNGGDGWALARHLHNAGARVTVAVLGDPRPESDAGINCAICRKMRIKEISIDELDAHAGADLVVDAIFGTGLDREVGGRARQVIEWINAANRPVLAVDVPSGLDCDTGRPLGVAVRAAVTVSFVGHKPAFNTLEAQPFVGEVVIGEIGVPRELIERLGTPADLAPPDPHRRSNSAATGE